MLRGTLLICLALVALPSVAFSSTREHTFVWTGPPDADLFGFRLHLAVGPLDHGEGRDIGLPTPGSDGRYRLTVADLDPELTYFAVLTAYDRAGNRSPRSNEVAVAPAQPQLCGGVPCVDGRTALGPAPAQCASALGAPRAVRRVWTDDPLDSLTVVWKAPYHAQGSTLRYRTLRGEDWQTLAGRPFRADGCEATYVARVDAAKRFDWYFYQVSGAGSAGPTWSGEYVAFIGNDVVASAQCSAAAALPGDVQVSPGPRPDTSVTVRWSAPLHFAGSQLRFRLEGKPNWKQLEASPESTTGCTARWAATLSGLVPGGSYEYQVSAQEASGPQWSAPATFDLGGGGGSTDPCQTPDGVAGDLETTRLDAAGTAALVSWSAPLQPEGSQLRYRNVSAGTPAEVIDGVAKTSVGCSARYEARLEGLTPVAQYYLSVSAASPDGPVWSGPTAYYVRAVAAPEPPPSIEVQELVLFVHRPASAAGCQQPDSAARVQAAADPLREGAVVDLASQSCACFGIEARADADVDSVRISHWVDDVLVEVLQAPSEPYAYGLAPGQLACAPALARTGRHRVRATPCSVEFAMPGTCASNGGTRGEPIEVAFTVVDTTTPPPPPPTTTTTPPTTPPPTTPPPTTPPPTTPPPTTPPPTTPPPTTTPPATTPPPTTPPPTTPPPTTPPPTTPPPTQTAVDALPSLAIVLGADGLLSSVGMDSKTHALALHAFATGRDVRPAWCELDGDANPEIVLGFGPGSAGKLIVLQLLAGSVAGASFIEAGQADYRAQSGETYPACGDLDGDGKDELVIGLGRGAAGWIQLLDDGTRGFAPYTAAGRSDGLLQWTTLQPYVTDHGGSYPAVGNIDADAAAEIVIGPGEGGAGRIFVLDDASTRFAPHAASDARDGWVLWSRSPGYTKADGSARPALADVDGDGRDDILLGLGAYAGGLVFVLDDAVAAAPFEPFRGASGGWITGARGAATRVAAADLDGDGRAEIVLGFEGVPALQLFEYRQSLIKPLLGLPRVDAVLDLVLPAGTSAPRPAVRP